MNRIILTVLLISFSASVAWAHQAVLPPDVKAVWDINKAYKQSTPTRERICLNGLWLWQPADSQDNNSVPQKSWGYFKVPGAVPGITDYMQKDSQRVFPHPDWQNIKLSALKSFWYQREFSIPEIWKERQILLTVEYLNSYAIVYVDNKRAGEIRFPGGELDITAVCKPGSRHTLSLYVVAMPLRAVMLSYKDTAAAKEVQGTVQRRGLCGDVYLVSLPRNPRINWFRVETSVRAKKISFTASLRDLSNNSTYKLKVDLSKNGRPVKTFLSASFSAKDLTNGQYIFAESWMPEQLWDIHKPQNIFQVELSLLDSGGQLLDSTFPERFGFREFWIDGKDFYLNGKRIYLSAVPIDNAQIDAALATYPAAKETMERLKSFGINFIYTHNYDCLPGSHLSFEEILRAADDVGMLVALTQPHFSHYDWQNEDSDRTNGYLHHAEFYVKVAGNHPSVVAYSTSHNATGYSEDMNPDMIDGKTASRDNWASRNVQRALRAEAIIRALDPSRIIYHHASGNLGSMHPVNFYPNFVPIQEMSDWFEHWALEGVKPVFLCEYAAPFTWDWTMYRGWYKGKREFGSARVPWEFCIAEWNAQFYGHSAYRISEKEKINLRWEAKQFRAGNLWYRWDYPYPVGSSEFDERFTIIAMYITDNWRAFRAWGVSAISPWEYAPYWKLRPGVNRDRQEFAVDWENLQRPGFSPDFIEQRYERMDIAFDRNDWVPTPAAQALYRNNMPLLAFIAGKPARFTSKDHLFFPGETVEKQLIIINNSRETVTCNYEWNINLPSARSGKGSVNIETGNQERIPVKIELPSNVKPGTYEIKAVFKFSNGEVQSDSFSITIMPRLSELKISSNIALFDPRGETAKMLEQFKIKFQPVKPDSDLSGYDILIIGKSALSASGQAPDISRVRNGLRVIVFEHGTEFFEKRLGFRVVEYGLRQVFPLASDHPLLAGLTVDTLRDWRGESTIVPPRLKYEKGQLFNGAPYIEWCDIPVTRLWRCGNRGNVASVLIEKPARGDFNPVLNGGYSLQYAPLLEYREGQGMILFCQIDVTGRTEPDPAALTLFHNIINYVSHWKPPPSQNIIYAGENNGREFLNRSGFATQSFDEKLLTRGNVLVIGTGGSEILANHKTAIANFVKSGGFLLAVGLDQNEANSILPFTVSMKKFEHISAFFEPAGVNSLFAGISPADTHNRDPRELPLIVDGAEIIGNGVLAKAKDANVVFCQLVPWQFDGEKQMNLKRTQRRVAYLLNRLLSNMGARGSTPLIEYFHKPVDPSRAEKRWLSSYYIDQPEEWDDPYRFFRW